MMTNILLGAMVFCLASIGFFTLMLVLVVRSMNKADTKDRRENEKTGHVCQNKELIDCFINDVYVDGDRAYSMFSEMEVCHECHSVTTQNIGIPAFVS